MCAWRYEKLKALQIKLSISTEMTFCLYVCFFKSFKTKCFTASTEWKDNSPDELHTALTTRKEASQEIEFS
jgi:hypothetical protein